MSASYQNLANKWVVLIIVTCFNTIANAQVHGIVVDSFTKEPIVGARILDTGSNLVEYSGFDGSFKLKSSESQIEIKALGYKISLITISKEDVLLRKPAIIKLVPDQINLQTVTVHSNYESGSTSQARGIERNAEQVINVVSSKTIQMLPDLTAGAVLQRVSGVSMEQSFNGEARYAIIRGMDRRYNYTLVNGIKIPSPDNQYRYVPMDMFPSDLLERLEVYKAFTPAMEGDAMGGGMNLVMKQAPNKFVLNISLGGGINEKLTQIGYKNYRQASIQKLSPTALYGSGYVATPEDFQFAVFNYDSKAIPVNQLMNITIGNRFLKSKKLGSILSLSHQKTFSGSENTWIKPNNQPNPGNVPSFEDIYTRTYWSASDRIGIHNNTDYIIDKDNKISIYNLYIHTQELQNRYSIDTSLSIGRDGLGTGNTYISHRSKTENQSIFNSTLQGKHKLSNRWLLDWSGVFSRASKSQPDWSEYQTVEECGFDINGNPTATPAVLNIPFYRIWTANFDRDFATYLNLSYSTEWLNAPLELKFGGLYRDKKRANDYLQWNLIPKTSSLGQPIPFDGILSADKFIFNGLSAAQGSPINPLTYGATEKISSGYFQLKSNLNLRLELLGGVRFEYTLQGWKTAQDPFLFYGAEGYVGYLDVLPSATAKYKVNDKNTMRFAYFSSINRPGFFEYVPYRIYGDNFSFSGNPLLKRAKSNNVDFRFEHFFNQLDQLLIGVFYKKIHDPIEMGVEFTGTSSATLKPFNFGTAVNYGLEASFMKYWNMIGVNLNYTYTYSNITTSKLYYSASFIQEDTIQTRPLQGQSPHIGNASLLYRNIKKGIEAQLSAVYTGKKITLISPYIDLDYWQKSMIQLSFSFNKNVTEKIVFFMKINNILNTKVVVEILQPNIYRTGNFALPIQTSEDRVRVQQDNFGRNYSIGLKYNI